MVGQDLVIRSLQTAAEISAWGLRLAIQYWYITLMLLATLLLEGATARR